MRLQFLRIQARPALDLTGALDALEALEMSQRVRVIPAGSNGEAGGNIHKRAQDPSNASIRFKPSDDSEQVEPDKREAKCGCVFHGRLKWPGPMPISSLSGMG